MHVVPGLSCFPLASQPPIFPIQRIASWTVGAVFGNLPVAKGAQNMPPFFVQDLVFLDPPWSANKPAKPPQDQWEQGLRRFCPPFADVINRDYTCMEATIEAGLMGTRTLFHGHPSDPTFRPQERTSGSQISMKSDLGPLSIRGREGGFQ